MKSLKVFKNKRVIVLGHTGFKGSWLTAWLKDLGANIMGISLSPKTSPSHYSTSKIGVGIKDLRLDIRNRKKLEKKITSFKPDFIFHLAAQAIVKKSFNNPKHTWETNTLGTVNILEMMVKFGVGNMIFSSSAAV